jgi:thiol-disulfide isomerase/thioredoxin
VIARRGWLAGGVGAVAALAGVGGALWWEQRRAVDAAFWGLVFPRPEGGELALAAFRGRPLLLNFWATWCPPCVREMPALDRFWRSRRAAGWQVIGLAVDGPTPVREFLQRSPVGYPIGLAGLDGTRLSRTLGNATGALPFSVVFGASGEVLARHLGEATPEDLERFASLA